MNTLAGVTFKVRAGVKTMTSNAATSAQAVRFRLAISDGRFWCSSHADDNNTIIRLDEYLINAVQGKKYVATLRLSCALKAYKSLLCEHS